MSFLSRLLRPRADDRAYVRPLWHRIVAIAREPEWYAECGIADTVPGRFDAITLVLAAVLLRMEREPELIEASVHLSELFVEDMEGQLRQNGIGDLVVGKHVGKLMGALGGRLGVLRDAMALGDGASKGAALTEVVARNVTMVDGGGDPARAAARLQALIEQIDVMPPATLLAGDIVR